MYTPTGTAPTGAPSPVLFPGPADTKLAWRRRVSRIGSLIQLGFAALWLGRGTLATGLPGRLPLGLVLVAGAVALGVWGEARTRGLAPRPSDPAARQLERAVTVATVLQLGASFGLPFVVIALGRPDLVVGTVSVTIGMLLLWLRATLRTPGHLVAGVLLLVVPVGLALALAGNALTAASGLAVAAVLVGSAVVGLGSLCYDPSRRRKLNRWSLATSGRRVDLR